MSRMPHTHKSRRLAISNAILGRPSMAATLLIVFSCHALLLASPSSHADTTVAQAIKHSQQTGKPIFAVAGTSYCPACQKLMNTLNTDQSLRPYIDQFVPLKINAQSDDYQRWKQFFPPKKAAIPALFIVTPQGREVYSAVGALPTQRLQQVLLTSLEKAERYPTKEQWKEIATTLESAEQALDEQRILEAAGLLQPVFAQLQQMGPLLELEDAGRDTVSRVKTLTDKQRSLLDNALRSLVSTGDLESALEVAALEGLLKSHPEHGKSVAVAIKKVARAAEQKTLLRQARELRQAESLARQPEAKSKRRAVAAYKRIAKRYPDSEASEHAQEKLAELSN